MTDRAHQQADYWADSHLKKQCECKKYCKLKKLRVNNKLLYSPNFHNLVCLRKRPYTSDLSRPVSVHKSFVAQKVFKCEVFIWFGATFFSDSIYRLSCRTRNITNFVCILRPAGENTLNLNITHNTQIIILIMSALLVELLCCMKNDIKRIINLIICNHLNFNLFSSLILSFLYTLKIVCNSY